MEVTRVGAAWVPGSIHRKAPPGVERCLWRRGAQLCGHRGMQLVIAFAGLALQWWLDEERGEAKRMYRAA